MIKQHFSNSLLFLTSLMIRSLHRDDYSSNMLAKAFILIKKRDNYNSLASTSRPHLFLRGIDKKKFPGQRPWWYQHHQSPVLLPALQNNNLIPLRKWPDLWSDSGQSHCTSCILPQVSGASTIPAAASLILSWGDYQFQNVLNHTGQYKNNYLGNA